MNLGKVFILMIAVLLTANFAAAINLDVLYLKINGEEMDSMNSSQVGTHTDNLKVRRGQDLDLKVRVQALDNLSNVQVEADIYGYRYANKEENLVSATSRTFDMSQGDIDTITLSLQVPTKMEKKYTILRVRVGDEDGLSFEKMYQLHVEGTDPEDAVIIKDFSFSPSSVINAGRAFTATVKVENIGDTDLDDVKVQVAVPALNIMDYQYLDELEADEKETLEEFLLRIPDCAAPGVYKVEITVEFDEYESTSKTTDLTVVPGDTCTATTPSSVSESKTTIVAPEKLEVKEGSQVSFPMGITNFGTTTKIYTLTVSGVSSWGTSMLSPGSQIVLKGGETKTVEVLITPNEDVSGERMFLVTVSTDKDSKVVPLTVKITDDEKKSSSSDLKKGLEIALIVLVIILIIVGLIIGFNKLRKNNGGVDDDTETQTYY
ncbi:MAG: putative S-layer protein [Nanoarchaeota archaeon]|nr:putative S-layer protein [Nanoarchaeota archaeon]MBU1270143.1 putative S-layer protein [Nanoarchaeota archaeon]MBU1604451.1 putative S-layer protein [Nanoarchaeota archaeon]MBU2443801.1 putative S-layer protein [Nanoarchaeota archaeon]